MSTFVKRGSNLHFLFGIGCLALAAYISYVVRFVGLMGDEGDTLAAAALITKGSVLYRDIFSHHFPFSYYWVAALFSFFGQSIAVGRLSTTLFMLLAFGATLAVTRRPLVVGLAALLWASASYFYLGNLALYQSLSAIALIPVFLTAYFVVTGNVPLSPPVSTVIAVFTLCALSANPLMIFPVGVVYLCLFLKRPPAPSLAWLVTLPLMGVALYIGYLAATNSLADFWAGVYTFNVDYYGRYSQAPSENYLSKILLNGATMLHLVTPDRAMFPIEALQTFDPASRWLLSEQAGKLAIIVLALLLLRRQPLGALLVYGTAAAALFRGRTNFDHLPWLAVAICTLPLLFTVDIPLAQGSQQLRAAWRIAVAALTVWIIGAGLSYALSDPSRLDYSTAFAPYEAEAETVRALSCGAPAHVAHYPGSPYLLFFVGAQPVSRYLFMLPWVADFGLAEERAALASRDYVVVVFRESQEAWGRPAGDYLKSLLTDLTERYQTEDRVYYQSPRLVQACQELASPAGASPLRGLPASGGYHPISRP